MDRSDLMKFWKLLNEAGFTGNPANLIEDDVRQMAEAAGMPESEIEAVLRGLEEFMENI